uniref:Uncharacterized protein n=1 Tax=Trieres chinensis TaxID=1514140 RepID=A0A6U1YL17_TRICV|mmetsp:Transcript_38303/g.78147  ORF Transcript_38303/g.78147 Transcript_38303/m.78147 type:complete len:121 (+) Transcript_38303:114-476(+)
MGAYTKISTKSQVLAHDDSRATARKDDEVYFDEDANEKKESAYSLQAKGAAAMFGAVGCIACGPILGLLAALFGAHTATHNKGAVGDVSRAMGDVAMAAKEEAKRTGLVQKSMKFFTGRR